MRKGEMISSWIFFHGAIGFDSIVVNGSLSLEVLGCREFNWKVQATKVGQGDCRQVLEGRKTKSARLHVCEAAIVW